MVNNRISFSVGTEGAKMNGYQRNTRWLFQCVFVSFLQIVSCATVSNLEAEYDHSAWLEPNEIYKLHWSVNHTDKSIKFAAEVKTTGWIGFGRSKGLTGKMAGADIVIGWVDSAGKGFLKDCHGTGNSRPSQDVKQDYTLTGSSQNSSWTVLKFKRYLNTCDNNTDNEIMTGTTRVIFAWNAGDPTGNLHSNLAFHGYGINRGSRSMNLLNYVKNTKIPEGVPYFDILQKNIKVPAKTTTYWCSPFKIADLVKLNSTKHVIEMGTIIQPRLEGLVHHILLYACKDDFDPAHLSITGECYGSMPSSIRECAGGTAIFAWAIGGNNFKFPANTGYPIGSLTSVKYVVMQTHFDNPGKRSDFVDTSGFRFYYTEPRKYDAAILTTGSVSGHAMVIPPNRTDWNIVGDCPKECSEKMGKHNIAPFGDSVQIFASFPHTHTIGKAIKTVLVRNGSAIEELIRDDNYDFDFQQTYVLKKEITFKPGDELKTTCTYDSRKRKYATVGGLATNDEMCLNFLYYYPSADFSYCITAMDYILNLFTAKYANPYWFPGMDRTRPPAKWQLLNWTGVVWNSTMVNELKAFYDYRGAATTWAGCLSDKNRVLFDGMIKNPQIKEQLPVPRDVCLDRTTKAPATSKRPTTRLTRPTTKHPSTTRKRTTRTKQLRNHYETTTTKQPSTTRKRTTRTKQLRNHYETTTTKQPSTTRKRILKPDSGATLSPVIILLPMSYICTGLFTISMELEIKDPSKIHSKTTLSLDRLRTVHGLFSSSKDS